MKRRRVPRGKSLPVELFVSYSHVNAQWFKRLQPLLKFTNPRTNPPRAWHDQELKAGDRWGKEIKEALTRMDVFVCLVSYEFLASGYIMDVEVKEALRQQKKNEVEIVPIVLYDMSLKAECHRLSVFNPLPAWGKCWRDYERNGGHYQDAHKEIRDGLRQAIDKVKARGR